MEYFVIVLLASLVAAALFQPLLGLFAFFIVAYVRPQDFYPYLTGMEPAKWILIITFISFIFHKSFSKTSLASAKQNWAILGILLCILISRVKVIDTLSWSDATIDFLRICMVYFLLVNLITSPKKLKSFYIFFLLINLFIALRFYISCRAGTAIFHGSKPGDMSLGFLANADDLGLGLVVAMPFALLPIYHAENKIVKGLSGLICGCFMLAALNTDSRGAHLGILVVFVASILIHIKWSKIKKQKIFVGLMLVLVLFAGFVYKYRYTLKDSYRSSQTEDDPGRMGRFATWEAAKAMIKDSPVIGIGRGNYVQYWQAHYPPGVFGYQVAHNIIYEVTAEIGTVGLLFFLFFSLYGIRELRIIEKKYKGFVEKKSFFEMIFMIYIISLTGFYVNGMFITVAFYWHIYVLVALFVTTKNIFMREAVYALPVSKK